MSSLPGGEKISKISGSDNRLLAITECGKCYYSCSDEWLELRQCELSDVAEDDGSGSQESSRITRFTHANATDMIAVAADSDGHLYSLPARIPCDRLCVSSLSCGKEHCLLLTSQGDVYSWGGGSRGQLGHGLVDSEDGPRRVEALGGVVISQVTNGGWHSAAVSRDGDLYMWGWNEAGQLGLPSLKTSVLSQTAGREPTDHVVTQCQPACVDVDGIDTHVAHVACGSRHTLILTDSGALYACGWNYYGQLGLGDRVSRDRPTRVPVTSVSFVRAGGWTSAVILIEEQSSAV